MFIDLRQTSLGKTAKVFAATALFSLPQVDTLGQEVDPIEATANQDKPQQREQYNVELARKVMPSVVGLQMNQELQIAVGSAELIQPPESAKKLLHPNEVIAISASHNFANWTDGAVLNIELFGDFESKGKIVVADEEKFRKIIGEATPQLGSEDSLSAFEGLPAIYSLIKSTATTFTNLVEERDELEKATQKILEKVGSLDIPDEEKVVLIKHLEKLHLKALESIDDELHAIKPPRKD